VFVSEFYKDIIKMKKITVYCGESITDKCRQQEHPAEEVKRAKMLIDSCNDKATPAYITYSNSPDFVSMIKYYAEKQGVETEFFLNGVSQGSEIDEIFRDFNRATEMICNLCPPDEVDVVPNVSELDKIVRELSSLQGRLMDVGIANAEYNDITEMLGDVKEYIVNMPSYEIAENLLKTK